MSRRASSQRFRKPPRRTSRRLRPADLNTMTSTMGHPAGDSRPGAPVPVPQWRALRDSGHGHRLKPGTYRPSRRHHAHGHASRSTLLTQQFLCRNPVSNDGPANPIDWLGRDHTRADELAPWRIPERMGEGRQRSNYPRTNFLYAMRCGWSASAPFLRLRSSMYPW